MSAGLSLLSTSFYSSDSTRIRLELQSLSRIYTTSQSKSFVTAYAKNLIDIYSNQGFAVLSLRFSDSFFEYQDPRYSLEELRESDISKVIFEDASSGFSIEMIVSLLDQLFFESILNIVQIFYVIVTMVIVYVYLKKAGSSFVMQPLSYLVSMTNSLL